MFLISFLYLFMSQIQLVLYFLTKQIQNQNHFSLFSFQSFFDLNSGIQLNIPVWHVFPPVLLFLLLSKLSLILSQNDPIDFFLNKKSSRNRNHDSDCVWCKFWSWRLDVINTSWKFEFRSKHWWRFRSLVGRLWSISQKWLFWLERVRILFFNFFYFFHYFIFLYSKIIFQSQQIKIDFCSYLFP